MALTVQSVNIPIHTANGPIWNVCTRKMQRATLLTHMLIHDTVIENFTSPAERIPYGGINARTHESGFTMVMNVTMDRHSFALADSIPAMIVIGFVSAKTRRQLAMTTASASQDSFLI